LLLPKLPPLLLPKLPLLLPLNKPPPPPLLKPQQLKPLLRLALWARLKPPGLEALGRALWLKLRLLLKLLRQWVDPALVRLELKRRWNQLCKALALRRVVSLQSLKLLAARQ
jgi:hypothetical protein